MGPGLVKSSQACSVPKSDRLGMTNSENNVTEEAASPHFFFSDLNLHSNFAKKE